LLTAGVHGDELSPVDAVQRIMAGLDPARISGTVIAIYGLARPAMEYIQRKWAIPQGGGSLIDFNRVWPGNETGNNTPTRHAGLLWNRLFINNVDVALDYHTASNQKDNQHGKTRNLAALSHLLYSFCNADLTSVYSERIFLCE
jgi:uncharacterized protein